MIDVCFLALGPPTQIDFSVSIIRNIEAHSSLPVRYHLLVDRPRKELRAQMHARAAWKGVPKRMVSLHSVKRLGVATKALYKGLASTATGPGPIYLYKPLLHLVQLSPPAAAAAAAPPPPPGARVEPAAPPALVCPPPAAPPAAARRRHASAAATPDARQRAAGRAARSRAEARGVPPRRAHCPRTRALRARWRERRRLASSLKSFLEGVNPVSLELNRILYV